MAWFETWFKNDLAKPINVVQLQGVMFNLDNLANKIGVELEYNGQPAALEGTIAGYVIRNDGTTLNLTTNTGKDGNKAWVILPQEAYTVEGPISIVIKLVYNSAETTIGACAGYVTRSRTSSEIAPTGTVIPSLASLEAAIAAANAAAANAADATDYIAPTEEESTASAAHAVGSYFIYNGKLMKATSAIAQGATIVPYASGVTNYNCAEETGGLAAPVATNKTLAMEGISKAGIVGTWTAPAESGTIATSAHAVGNYFTYNGYLYRATTAIAQGATIVTTGENANCALVPGGLSSAVLENHNEIGLTAADIATVETRYNESVSTASAAHAKGSYFILGGVLYMATANIAIGNNIVTSGASANCEAVTGGAMGQVADLKSAIDSVEDSVNEQITSSAIEKYFYNLWMLYGVWSDYSSAHFVGGLIAVNPGDNIIIKTGNLPTRYTILTTDADIELGENVNFATGASNVQVSANSTVSGTVPDDGKYLCVIMGADATYAKPSEIKINGYDAFKGIRENITKNTNDISALVIATNENTNEIVGINNVLYKSSFIKYIEGLWILSGKWANFSSVNLIAGIIKVNPGDVINIKTGNIKTRYTILTRIDDIALGNDVHYATGASNVEMQINSTASETIPSDGKYFIIMLSATETYGSPEKLAKGNYNLLKSVQENIGENTEAAIKVFHVTAETGFVSVFEQAKQYENSIVYVDSGVYDILEELGGNTYYEAHKNDTTPNGLFAKNGIHVIGQKGTVLKAEYGGSYTGITDYFSIIHTDGNCTFENIQFVAQNIRYCVHDDVHAYHSDNYPVYTAKFMNCEMNHKGTTSITYYAPCPIGCGTSDNSCLIVEDGYYTNEASNFPYVIAEHGHSGSASGEIIIKGVYLGNGKKIWIRTMSGNTAGLVAYVHDCSMGQQIETSDSAGLGLLDVRQWNNVVRT